MKKIFLLSLLICSLKANEMMQNLEASILASNLEQAKKTLTELTLSKKDKKRLLKLSDDIIARRQAAFGENYLLNPDAGYDLFFIFLQIISLKISLTNLPEISALKHSLKSSIDNLKKLIVQYPDSSVFPQLLQESYEIQDDNFFNEKLTVFTIALASCSLIIQGYYFLKTARNKRELLNTELTNALMIYQLLYQIETHETQSA